MYTFYNDMRGQIIDFSRLNNRTLLSDEEIKSLKPYVDAPQDFKEDFDGTIFGSPSKGVSKPKTKALSSPYSSGHITREYEIQEAEPIIEEPVKVSPYYTNGLDVKDIAYPIKKEANNQVSEIPISDTVETKGILIPFPIIKLSSQSKETNTQTSPYYYVPSEVDPIDQLIA